MAQEFGSTILEYIWSIIVYIWSICFFFDAIGDIYWVESLHMPTRLDSTSFGTPWSQRNAVVSVFTDRSDLSLSYAVVGYDPRWCFDVNAGPASNFLKCRRFDPVGQ